MPDAVRVMVGVTPEMIHHWGWFLILGIALLLLGVAAVARSFAATVASMVFFGWLLVLASLIEFVDAFMVGQWAGFFSHVLLAIAFGIVGLLMVLKPVISAEALTLLMSIFFLISGLYQLLASLWIQGWGWQAVNGIIAAGMGVLILAQWPVSGLWVIGLFVGIDLIFSGWTWIALALNLRRLQ
jgi:uncharacterized membrane protein HdeD (DUF308 family)